MSKFHPLELNPAATLPAKSDLLRSLRVLSHEVDAGRYIVRFAAMSDATEFAQRVDPVPAPIVHPNGEDDIAAAVPAGLGFHLFGADPAPWTGWALCPGPFTGALYAENPDQVSVVRNTVQKLRDRKYATIESPVGSGKTVMITKIVLELGVRTLFVTTTTNLLEQARDQGFAVFAPHLRVGQLRGRKYKPVEDCDVVLCCPRTLVAEHDPQWFTRFGLLVFDEAHKAATSEMLQSAAKLRCEYRLGVSATLRRNDDKYALIPAILGDVVTRLVRIWSGVRYVSHMIGYASHPNNELPVEVQRWGKFKGKCDMHKYMQTITALPNRTAAICDAIQRDLDGRQKIFVYAAFVAHLEAIQAALRHRNIEAGVLYQKTNKGDALAVTMAHRVILTTYGSGVEGVNDAATDTIYFASPFSHASTCRLEQCVGRCRPGPNKPPPLIRDFVDRCPLGYAMHRKRVAAANKLSAQHTRVNIVV